MFFDTIILGVLTSLVIEKMMKENLNPNSELLKSSRSEHPVCFSALPAILATHYLDRVCSINQDLETPESAIQQQWRKGTLENRQYDKF